MGQVGKVIGKVKYGSPCFLVPLFLQTASLRCPNCAFLLHCCAHLRCGAGGDSSAAQMSGVRSQKRSAACGTAEAARGRRGRLPFPETWLRYRRPASPRRRRVACPRSYPSRARTAVPLPRLGRVHLIPLVRATDPEYTALSADCCGLTAAFTYPGVDHRVLLCR